MTLRLRDRIALGGILILAVIGAFYLLVLKPEHQRASTLATSIAGQRNALTTAQSNYATGHTAQASIKASAAQWAAVREAVPETSDIPALLRVLERKANAVHVQMQAITLSGSAASAAATSTPAPTTSGATSVPVQLTFAGGYTALHNLVRHLDGLVVVSGGKVYATGPLLSIGSVALSGTPKLTVQITASIYQLSAATAAAAAAPGGS
jgi:hypothetical protein